MKRLLVGILVLAFLGISGTAPAGEKKMAKMKEVKLWAPGDLQWMDNPESPGAKTAVLWGDPKSGPYAAINKWPAGTVHEWHTHTNDVKAIVLSGTFALTLEGQAEKEVASGGVVMIPGGTPHRTACRAGAECVYYAEQPGAGDEKPVAMK